MTDLTAVSLFAGIEGFGLALDRCGIAVKAAIEIDQDCRGVIASHFPGTRLFNDITEVTGEQLRAAGFTPRRGILAGGWPCQDLSVAGRRAGLGGARSGLFWQVVRLADELLPQWLVLENVPGLLSAVCPCPGDEACLDNGRAVACGRWETKAGKRAWLGHVIHTPPGGRCRGGCMEQHGGAMGSVIGALEQLGYGLCWRVLDSRFFRVAQRRERVFIVGCLGDGAAPVEVLLEPEGGAGHPAPRRPQGTDIAGTIGSRAGGSRTTDLDGHGTYVTGTLTAGSLGDYDDNTVRAGFMVTVPTAATLQGGGRRGHRIDAEGAAGGHLIPFDMAQITSPENRANPAPGDPAPTLNGSAGLHVADTAYALTARNDRNDREENYVTFPVANRGRGGGARLEAGEPGDPAFTLRTPAGGSSYPMIAHALTSEGADASADGTGRGTPLVVAATLTSGRATGEGVRDPGRRREDDANLVAVPLDLRNAARQSAAGETAGTGIGDEGDPSYGLSATARALPGVQTGTAVRRLTPRETERLQDFPDDWTRWKLVAGELVEQSDSARYRQVGNAVTTSVAEWIIRRLVAVDERGGAA